MIVQWKHVEMPIRFHLQSNNLSIINKRVGAMFQPINDS